jgi:hypothetical protein
MSKKEAPTSFSKNIFINIYLYKGVSSWYFQTYMQCTLITLIPCIPLLKQFQSSIFIQGINTSTIFILPNLYFHRPSPLPHPILIPKENLFYIPVIWLDV